MTVEHVQHLFAARRHGCILLDRMARLEEAGFKAVHHRGSDFIEFVHISKSVRAVALRADGRVADLVQKDISASDRISIEPEDNETLSRWLDGLPRPKWWQRL